MAREGQGYPYPWHDMMIYIYIYIIEKFKPSFGYYKSISACNSIRNQLLQIAITQWRENFFYIFSMGLLVLKKGTEKKKTGVMYPYKNTPDNDIDRKTKTIEKTNFLTAESDQKKADDTNRLEIPTLRERERERERERGGTRNHASPTLTFLFSTLKETTKP